MGLELFYGGPTLSYTLYVALFYNFLSTPLVPHIGNMIKPIIHVLDYVPIFLKDVICYQHVLDNEKCDYAYSPKAVLTSGGI
jgi:hypothetical protein